MNCGDCRYFLKSDKDLKSGVCRRLPPSVQLIQTPAPPRQFMGGMSSMQMQQLSFWPSVQLGQWCGEFIAAQEEAPN